MIAFVGRTKARGCKRPYSLGKRLEQSDQKRTKILAVLRKQLEAKGFSNLALDDLARESGVTRQTIYNLFSNKTGLLEALFDQIAREGGMERMREVMQTANPEAMLVHFIEIFTTFWAKDRLLMRRIHGIAAIDPEFGAVVEARNQRRIFAATRVIEMLNRRSGAGESLGKDARIAILHALTSFEFFDALATSKGSVDEAAHLLPGIVERAINGK
ncbi:MAG TPA: TetR/AcrR family transcriptional regulator [Alloacidobacterium sp.]|jgi:AcrR family transcriptional regulator|nr:TetR/AcrR family transcriptional regulator [Alloacidobacterium sp.]